MTEKEPEELEGGFENKQHNQEGVPKNNEGEFKKLSPEQMKLVDSYLEKVQERTLLIKQLEEKQQERDSIQAQVTSQNQDEFRSKLLEADAEVQHIQNQVAELSIAIADIVEHADDETKKKWLVLDNVKTNEQIKEEILQKQEASNESRESHEFTIKEISELLFRVDGKERPDLVILDEQKDMHGNTIGITFTNNEKEVVDNEECEVTYLLTMAGERYKKDGSVARVVSQTSLSKDYDDGMGGSDQIADYINGRWENVAQL